MENEAPTDYDWLMNYKLALKGGPASEHLRVHTDRASSSKETVWVSPVNHFSIDWIPIPASESKRRVLVQEQRREQFLRCPRDVENLQK